MRWVLGILLLLLAGSAWGANTHGGGDVLKEMQAIFGDVQSPFAVSGCTPTVPVSSLTFGAFACTAYVRGASGELVYSAQASASLGPLNAGNGTYWVALHRDATTAVGGWTRQAVSNYLWQLATTEPATPSGALLFAQVTVAGGVITAVTARGPLPQGCLSVANYSGDYAQRVNSAIAALPSTGGCVDARMMRGAQTSATSIAITKPVTLWLPPETWTYTGSGCVVDLQLGSNGSKIVGNGQTSTILRASGTAGTEKGICTTVTIATSTNRAQQLHLQDFQLQGSGSGTTPGTVGTIGIDAESWDHIYTQHLSVRNWGIGIRVSNLNATTDPTLCPPAVPAAVCGTGYYGMFAHTSVFYNATYGYQFYRGANSYLVTGGRVAGNAVNMRFGHSPGGVENIVVNGVSLECAGVCPATNSVEISSGAVGLAFTGNRFETGKTILIESTAQNSYFSGNFYSGDTIEDTSTCRCSVILEPWGTNVTGGGTQGKTTPPSGVGIQDVVSNGSFEYDLDNGGIADNWSEVGAGGGTYTWAVQSGGRCGTKYQRLDNTSHSNSRLAQLFPVAIGHPYVISFYGFQTANVGNVGIRVGTTANETAYITIKTPSYADTTWRHAYGVVTPTEATMRLTLISGGTTATAAGWDCVSVTPGTLPPQYSEPPQFTTTISLVPGTVNAQTVKLVTATSLIGLTVGDLVVLNPTTTPTTNVGLVFAYINAANQLTHAWVNPTAGNIAAATQNYKIQVKRQRP